MISDCITCLFCTNGELTEQPSPINLVDWFAIQS